MNGLKRLDNTQQLYHTKVLLLHKREKKNNNRVTPPK